MLQIAEATVHVAHTSQLWPTLTRACTLAGALLGGFAAVYSRLARKESSRVHVLVNGQFTDRVNAMEAAADRVEKAAALVPAAAATTAATVAATVAKPPEGQQ
jgi:hypothetical protein